MLSLALTAIVIGVMATLYGFAAVRLSDAYTRSSLSEQVNGVADKIELTIRNAHSCALDPNGNLRCVMPLDGVDSDGDGHYDSYYPFQLDTNGEGLYGSGPAVWFYNAGPDAIYNSGLSGNVWSADMRGSLGLTPTPATLDHAFAYYYDGNLRYPLVTGLSFSLNAATHSITYTVSGSTGIGAETSQRTGADTSGRDLSITRTVTWRNFK